MRGHASTVRASGDRTEEVIAAVARLPPDLAPAQQQGLAALVRTLASSQTWLRMREEFGIDGNEAGPLVAWAVAALAAAARDGDPPPGR